MMRKTHAQNIAAMDRRPSSTDHANTATEQQANELLRVLRLGWNGQWAEFEQFSANHLTAKGEKIAKATTVGSDDRRELLAAIRAGY
jgi:HJR/Mrr/RecB family endonuclease